jgi:hypothetical protein
MVLGMYSAYGYLTELWLSKALLKASFRSKKLLLLLLLLYHNYMIATTRIL